MGPTVKWIWSEGSFDPFGAPFEASGSGASDFGYTGEWWGSYTELLFLRARYYDPAVGRFLNKDPFPGFAQRPATLHAYAYVTNNPINGTDASGYQGGPVADTAGGGGIAVCFGVAFAIPEPFFIEEGICTLIALGLLATTPAIGAVVQDGVTTEDTFHPFPTDPQLDPLPPFELELPDPLHYNPGATLDAGLEQTLTLPGFPTDQAEPGAYVYEFPLVQPCIQDYILHVSWKVGDPIDQTDEYGQYPSWSTVRERYWKTRAREATRGELSRQNVGRMKAGYSPLVRIIARNRNTGELEEMLISKELHHIGGRSGNKPHARENLRELWPWEHEQIDPSRYLDYDFVRFR